MLQTQKNLTETEVAYQQRRQILLACPVECDDFYGAGAILDLVNGKDRAEANTRLQWVARWFEHPHPQGRDPQGECDFTAIKLTRAYHLFHESSLLEEQTLDAIQRFFLNQNFCSIYQSENHGLLFHTSRCLMAQAYPLASFQAYQASGDEILLEELLWLKRYLRYRACEGWGEFDSPYYLGVVWECLTSLYDFVDDAELKHLCHMMLDVLVADIQVDSLNGLYGGAHGRIYPPHALDHVTEATFYLHYLYFGNNVPQFEQLPGCMVDALTSAYRPHSLLTKVALERVEPYENRERKHLHNVADVLPQQPLAGSIRKYTYWNPKYVLGCVQYQDAYSQEGCIHHPHHQGQIVQPEQRNTVGYAWHQQHQWDLTFPQTTKARVFTHHPGCDETHNYWTGDRQCGCGHFFQHKSVLLALNDIPPEQPSHFIHAYLPKAAFDEVIEEKGTIYIRSRDTFAALTILPHYKWTTEGEWQDVEIISSGLQHGVVCEVGTVDEFADFNDFRSYIRTNHLDFKSDSMELEYHSGKVGLLRLNSQGLRQYNGEGVDLDYATYDNPFMYSQWQSGVIEVRFNRERLIFDFNR